MPSLSLGLSLGGRARAAPAEYTLAPGEAVIRMAQVGDAYFDSGTGAYVTLATEAEAEGRVAVAATRSAPGAPASAWWGNRNPSPSHPALTTTTNEFWRRFPPGSNALAFSVIEGGTSQSARIAWGSLSGGDGNLKFASSVLTFTAPARRPGAPTPPTLTNLAAGRVDVLVQPVPSGRVNGATITGYRVESSITADFASPTDRGTVTVAGLATPMQITGLSGLLYFRTIALSSDFGDGLPSSAATITLGSAATVPPKPGSGALVFGGGVTPTISLPGPFLDGGSAVIDFTVRIYAEGGASPVQTHVYTLAEIGAPPAVTEFDIAGLAPGVFEATVTVRNAVGSSAPSNRVAATVVPSLAISDGESAIIIGPISGAATAVPITVIGGARAGEYTVTLAALAGGAPVALAQPLVTEGADNVLSATPALWVYDADAVTSFDIEYAWVTDTGEVLDAPDFDWQRSTYRAVRFREIATADLTVVTSLSALVPAITVPATVIASGAPRPVSITSVFPSGLRGFSVAGQFEPTAWATIQRILSRDTTNTNNIPGLQIATGGNVNLLSGGTSIANLTLTGATTASAAGRPRVSVAASVDLDRYGAATNRQMSWVQNGVLSDADALRVSADATAHDPALRLNNVGTLFARANTLAEPFVGTIRAWVWMHDVPFAADVLRDALFEVVPTTVDPTGWAPRLLPANGAVTIAGSVVVPKLFLTGDNLGQTEASPGVWVVPNRGSAGGNLSLLNGAFA